MKRNHLLLVLLACVSARAQAPVEQPRFDVTYARALPRRGLSVTAVNGGSLTFQSVPLSLLIQRAYGIRSDRLFGPNWLDVDMFEVLARTEGVPPQPTIMAMLQTLLADRFKLVLKIENRPQPVYALVVGTGKLQLRQSSVSEPNCSTAQEVNGSAVVQRLTCIGATSQVLANRIAGFGSGYLDGQAVIDETGLTGAYDLDLRMVPAAARAATGEGESLFTAVEKLGLKLEKRNVQAPAYVVESANRTPTPNTPEAEELLGHGLNSKQFDVATLKLIPPGVSFNQGVSFGSGAVSLTLRMPIKDVLPLISNLPTSDVVGWPEYADDIRIEIQGQVPPDTPKPTPTSYFSPMIRNLLVSRMGLKMHSDVRNVDTYVLTAPEKDVKMELGIDERGACKSTPDKIFAHSGISAMFTCTNMAMRGLADQIQNLAPGYVNNIPVVDETRLGGTYNFALAWTGLSSANGRANAGQTGDAKQRWARWGASHFLKRWRDLA